MEQYDHAQDSERKLKLSSFETTIDELIGKLQKQIDDYLHHTVKPMLQYYHLPIEDLNLPPRAYHCLKKAGVNVVGHLLQNSEEDLLNLKNGFGKKSLQDVNQALSKYSLILKSDS
jgi:DNA-directed RNA polymerase alpha subunit